MTTKIVKRSSSYLRIQYRWKNISKKSKHTQYNKLNKT